MIRPLTVGSLFAGIGGFDLGLERAGMVVKWQVEIDPFCRAVLAKHWPDVRRYEDVREICGGKLRRSREDASCAECGRRDHVMPVDVICGGFPCQDVSESGSRAGIDGPQSGLWREMSRLVGELRPKYLLVENVSGLLVSGMGRVVGDLSRLGYDAEWGTLSACAFGAPHTRERVFIVAYPNAGRRRTSWPVQVEAASATRPLISGQPSTNRNRLADWPSEPGLSRVADGVPAVVDRGAGLGNGITPIAAEWIGQHIVEAEAFVAAPIAKDSDTRLLED